MMKKLNRVALVFLVLALTLTVIVSCNKGSKDSSASAKTDSGKNILRVAIVTSPSGTDDGNFNFDVHEGVRMFEKDCAKYGYDGVMHNNVNEKNMDWETGLAPAIRNIVTEYDVIVLSGFQFGNIGLKEIAESNPDVAFMLVDSFVNDENFNTVSIPNVYAVQFAEQEGGFMAGMAAALQTKTNKVAVVNGIAYPSNVNYEYGFYSGVNYVNKERGKRVEAVEVPSRRDSTFGGNYLGTFTDATVGKTVGDELIRLGADVIFPAAGGAGNGVFAAAKENNNVYIIGCDADEWASGYRSGSQGANVVLTSALKVLHKAVYDALVDYTNGSFKGGQNLILNAEQGDYTGFVSGEHCQLSDADVAFMNEAYAKIKSGEIVPAGQFTSTKYSDFAASPAVATPRR